MRWIWGVIFVVVLTGLARAQPVNVRISDPALKDPEEVSIALDPKDPNFLAAGANLNYLFTSSDSGMSWDVGRLYQGFGVWGDPCLMYDDSGVLYFEHLSGHAWPPRDTEFLWRIVAQRSTDHGLSFDTDGAFIGYAPPTMQDKAWLGLDRSKTAANGTLYTSWTEFDKYGSKAPQDSSRIFFSKSTDRGLTWSDRVRIDDTGGDCLDGSGTDEGAATAASPDGTINLVWTARERIYFNQSSDGGKTWTRDRVIADQPGGWDFDVPGISRANGFAMIACDCSPTSEYLGRLYVEWSDQRRGVTDVYSIYSTNNGASWSTPTRVNTDSALNHHFFPSMALDPVTGHIFIVFYDRRNYTDNQTDVYLARSNDGGESFTNERISESAFLPYSQVFFGDYIHITAYDRHVYPIWMRESDSLLSVWTAPIYDAESQTFSGVEAQTQNRLWIVSDGVRPSVAFTLEGGAKISIDAFDLLGRHIQSLLAGEFGEGQYRFRTPLALASGAYIIRMTAISQTNGSPGGFTSLVTKLAVP